MRRKQTATQQACLLFELYEQRMYAVAFAVLHDSGRAEDAVMDAFERVLRRGIDCDPRSKDAQRLVLSAVKSTSIDAYRKQKRERAHAVYPGDEVLELVADCAGESAMGAASAMGATLGCQQDAAEMLEGLPQQYRDVLTERIVEQRSVAETADDLHISQSNVRKRQERALKVLRNQMGVSYGI